MSEIKFACPHCAQHIACADAYCGNSIACPACGKQFFVPPLAAFTAPPPGKLALAMPVGAKSKFEPHAPEVHPWTAEEWDKHAASLPEERADLQPMVWLFLVTPFVVALILVALGVRPPKILSCFLISALLAGFGWAYLRKLRGGRLILAGVLGAVATLFVYGCVAIGVLIAGCALL